MTTHRGGDPRLRVLDYIRHKVDCDETLHWDDPAAECTCGLDQLKAEVEAALAAVPRPSDREQIEREYYGKGYARGQTEACRSCHQCGGKLTEHANMDTPGLSGLRCAECDERDRYCEELEAKVAARPGSSDLTAPWQAIETAPKDGTAVIGFDPRNGNDFLNNAEFMRWIDGAWRDPETYKRKPTHWMPLPHPPTTDSAAEQAGMHDLSSGRSGHEDATLTLVEGHPTTGDPTP